MLLHGVDEERRSRRDEKKQRRGNMSYNITNPFSLLSSSTDKPDVQRGRNHRLTRCASNNVCLDCEEKGDKGQKEEGGDGGDGE